MKTLVIILGLFIILVTTALASPAQPPTQNIAFPTTVGTCTSTVGVACNGSNTPFFSDRPDFSCATGPSSVNITMCVSGQAVEFYNSTTGAMIGSSTALGRWVTTSLGATAVGGAEPHVVFDPFINPSGRPAGAFVFVCSCAHVGGAKQGNPIIAVSTSADPTRAWNSRQLSTTSYGDMTLFIGFDANGLIVMGLEQPTYLSDIIWGWGSTHQAALNSSLPVPDVTFDHNSTPLPSYVVWPILDYTVGKPSAAPFISVSNCDNFAMGCQGTPHVITLTFNEITWTSGTTATLAKYSVNTGNNYGGTPNLGVQPGNNRLRVAESHFPGYGIELSNKHVYTSAPMGKQSTDYNGFKAFDVDLSNPSRPRIKETYTVGGGTKYDAVFPSTVADSAGNVFWVFLESNATTFVTPAIAYLANGRRVMQGPYLLNAPTTSGTISTAGTDCSVRTNCVSFTLAGSPMQVGAVVSGSFTGTLQFEDSKGNSITATPAGGGSTTPCTTAAGAWTFPTTGLSGVRVRASALSSGRPTINFQAVAGSAYPGTGCRNANPPAFQGNFSSAQIDPSNGRNVWVYGVAAFSNVKCQWTTEAVQFTLQ